MTYDPQSTIISQYGTAPRLTQMVTDYFNALGARRLVEEFYTKVWNIDTATGWGLDFWGKIVGVGRVLTITTGEYLGWAESVDAQPFNQGIFYAGVTESENYPLSDDAYRVLILAKALANITDCTIPGINDILQLLFPDRGNCYVQDNNDMSLTYVFTFSLSPVEEAIILQSGVLPRPAGVEINVSLVP
jgi:hypothetical protein